MKATAARSLGPLISKIHPQVALSPQECKKLLTSLTSSFREHLDREHPSDGTNEATFNPSNIRTGAEAAGFSRGRQGLRSSGQRGIPSSSSSTDRHLQSVLTHPLFARSPRKERSPSPNRSQPPQSGFEEVRRLYNDPITWFEEQVGHGTATLELASYCLQVHRKGITEESRQGMKKTMMQSNAGSKISRWLWSSGEEERSSCLRDEKFMNGLIPYLVAEERLEPIWRWMRLPVSSFEDIKQKARFLKLLVLAECTNGQGAESAFAHFRFVQRNMKQFLGWENTLVESHSLENQARRTLLKPAGRYLATSLTWKGQWPSREGVEDFLGTMADWSERPGYYKARLHLINPTSCDPMPALKYLRNISTTESFELQSSINSQAAMVRQRRGIVQLGFKTTEVLLSQEHYDDAAWVLNFLQHRYPSELGLDQADRKRSPVRHLSAATLRATSGTMGTEQIEESSRFTNSISQTFEAMRSTLQGSGVHSHRHRAQSQANDEHSNLELLEGLESS
ncbi:MAG: Saccharopine dehydrogenase [Sclerophora amabilis]|nr:MAG: Saccharopine dehydrogenase [Sclerophora amabilis]